MTNVKLGLCLVFLWNVCMGCGAERIRAAGLTPVSEGEPLAESIRGGAAAGVLPVNAVPRFISKIECVDSCLTQSTSFSYDSDNRLNLIRVDIDVAGERRSRTTRYRYTSDRIVYETSYYVDNRPIVRRDKGYVVIDKKGRASKGGKMQMKKNSWAQQSFSIFDQPDEFLVKKNDRPSEPWIRCQTNYEFKYDSGNDLRRVNQFCRFGNMESAEQTDLWWNVGNISMTSDTRSDCSYLYGEVANKTNLDLNRYMAYFFAENTNYADPLFGLLGVYGTRSELLCTEYSNDIHTFLMDYEVDEQGYVTKINVDRIAHPDMFQVQTAETRLFTANGATDTVQAQPARQSCTLVLTYK